MSATFLPGWELLRHGGLLLDPKRLGEIAASPPEPLSFFAERELRRRVPALGSSRAQGVATSDEIGSFVRFVLGTVCGFDESLGSWKRGPEVPAAFGRAAPGGETVKPRHLWQTMSGGRLPVFIERERHLGLGRGRRATSNVLGWLRAGDEQLAVITNGRQWRLVFAGLDYEAWCEWDIDLWLEEGSISDQVTALRALLAPRLWTPPEQDAPMPLLTAIRDSRKGQAELSAVLGERVRTAVETVIRAHGDILAERLAGVDRAEIYRAAVRMVMRQVVVLFAEARELLPTGNALYHGSYGLGGLFEELEKSAARGRHRLSRSFSAWPRLLALFRLIHEGSHHPSLPVPAYGGELFAPGDPDSASGLSRALAVFENASFERELFNDRDVHAMLEEITRTRVKVRQGRASTWVAAPVDFSDLSSEYIGILYEGLLDFELKEAPATDPIIFLSVGNQPALPLSRLEAMDDKALKDLFEALKDKGKKGDEEQVEEEDEAADDDDSGENEDDENAANDDEAGQGGEGEDDGGDARHTTRSRAEVWARRAVAAGKLVPALRGKRTPEKDLEQEQRIARKAHQLVVHVVLPGEWYLVRWGGTRKGAGTFYTRPGLAVPTVQRTLRPLCYGAEGVLAPETILALKVCDPACGSGTFPVAALRYLTSALYESLHHHGRIFDQQGRALVSLLEGPGMDGAESACLASELLPCAPDEDTFEPRLKAVLRRHVVERCIYGVDLDPLAVELCRLALWVETMDRTLPFSFLDHKIKCGNALVGAWFDQYRHYPAMAWKNRDGGDHEHRNGVHFEQDARSKALKAFVKQMSPLLRDSITGQARIGQGRAIDARAVHHEALAVFEQVHQLPVHQSSERAELYGDLVSSASWQALKDAMDLWCACWFWPADDLATAPLPVSFADVPGATRIAAAELAARHRFFHWELEFPDVFREDHAGFDAVLGNPPWEIAKPNSKEYFSDIDPLYRTYGKQEALSRQTQFFSSAQVERAWLDYNAHFRAQSNLFKFAARPYGDPKSAEAAGDKFSLQAGKANEEIHGFWRKARAGDRGFADPDHPFARQGSADVNLYKLFLEQGHALLRKGGRLGFIVPSGLYSDHGTGALRELFLEHCSWEWLFGFENRDKIFDIDSRFKFNPVIIQKGGRTSAIRAAFMRRRLEDWERAEDIVTDYAIEQVERFSPRSRAILEIQSARDLEILEKIYANSVLLGDEGPEGWGVRYAREFDMTNDSKLFPPRPQWEAKGYRPDEYSRWILGDWRPIGELWAELGVKPLAEGERRCAQPPYDRLPIPRADIPEGVVLSREADAFVWEQVVREIGLPLYQGRMLYVNNWAASAVDRECGRLDLQPEFILDANERRSVVNTGPRVAFRDIARNSDMRSFIAALLPAWFPCGNKVPLLLTDRPLELRIQLAAICSSLAFDWATRIRLCSASLNWHVVESLAALTPELSCPWLRIAASAALTGPQFAPEIVALRQYVGDSWRPARTHHERLRIQCTLDAIIFASFGLSATDVRHILRDCTRPSGQYRGLDPKGFWRIDKDKDPELRQTVLTLVAYDDLSQCITNASGDCLKGIAAFAGQHGGDGWKLPDAIQLIDVFSGQDDRAWKSRPVVSRCGPRFADWQLSQSTDEFWNENRLHARNLIGAGGLRARGGPVSPTRGFGGSRAAPTVDTAEVQGGNAYPSLFDEDKKC